MDNKLKLRYLLINHSILNHNKFENFHFNYIQVFIELNNDFENNIFNAKEFKSKSLI